MRYEPDRYEDESWGVRTSSALAGVGVILVLFLCALALNSGDFLLEVGALFIFTFALMVLLIAVLIPWLLDGIETIRMEKELRRKGRLG